MNRALAVSEVTVSDVLEARRFWFPNGTIALMPGRDGHVQ